MASVTTLIFLRVIVVQLGVVVKVGIGVKTAGFAVKKREVDEDGKHGVSIWVLQSRTRMSFKRVRAVMGLRV